jgi:molybdopterin/thiamine biosynthesis adenylyltransferase
MTNYFLRQIQLWGEETQMRLRSKKVVIIGAGGLGSSLTYALGSCGLGEVHIVDFDDVALHNIHRQISFMMGDEGKGKAQLNAEVVTKRSPYTKSFAYNISFEEWIKKDIAVDLIIDATDNLETRSSIDNYAKKKNLPWIYGSVEAFHGQVAFIEKSSFNSAFKIAPTNPEGVATPIVMHIASLQANLALRYFANLSIKKEMLYYLFFNNEGELITQKFTLPTT